MNLRQRLLALLNKTPGVMLTGESLDSLVDDIQAEVITAMNLFAVTPPDAVFHAPNHLQ